MKKLYIVKNERDFDKIIKFGKKQKNNSFIIYSLPNYLPYDRFGVSVGKKLGNAVFRNKYKRKIRSIIDNYKKLYGNSKDYIIILRRSHKEKDYQTLKTDFFELMTDTRKDKKYENKN